MSQHIREASATKLIAEFFRNNILDAQVFADHFRLGEVTSMKMTFYEDGIIRFTFTKEP